jgi:hypothetical protein
MTLVMSQTFKEAPVELTKKEIPLLKNMVVNFEIGRYGVEIHRVEVDLPYFDTIIDITSMIFEYPTYVKILTEEIQDWWDENKDFIAESERENRGMDEAKELGA